MNKVCVYQDLENLPNTYKAIFADTDTVSDIFQSLPWFRNLAANGLPTNTSLRIYAVESAVDGTPLLILPLCSQIAGKKPFSPHNLQALSTFYTSLFGPIIGKSNPLTASSLEENVQALVKEIATERPHWDTIDLHPMAVDTQIFGSLINAFRKNGMAVQRYFCFGNWYLNVNNRTFQKYYETLPSNLRNTLERKSKQLQNAGRLRIRIFSSVDELDIGINAYEKIYNASWKTPETYPAFMPGLIRT
ncbi:MAG: GNAT family N-acetyltransferase, partial [Burkholderiaceae bacterium]